MARASRIRSYYGTILDEGRQKINKPRKPNPADDEQIDGTKKDGICLWYLYIYIYYIGFILLMEDFLHQLIGSLSHYLR